MPRRSLAAVSIIALLTAAAAATRSAQTLARAKKLYAKHDYVSASIEAYVLARAAVTSTVGEQQEGELLVAESFARMKLRFAALDKLAAITHAGASHAAYLAVLPWYVEIGRALPDRAWVVPLLDPYTPSDFADTSLDAVRTELLLWRAQRTFETGAPADAAAALAPLTTSADVAIAERAAELHGLAARDAGELAVLAKTATDPDAADRAALFAGRLDVAAGKAGDAKAHYALAPHPSLDRAFEASVVARIDRADLALLAPYFGLSDAQGSTAGPLEVAIYAGACAAGAGKDPLRRLREHGAEATKQIIAWLDAQDDDGDLVRKALASGAAPKGVSSYAWTMMRFAAAHDARARSDVALLAEADAELTRYQTKDRAWRTTAVAADALETEVLGQSLVEQAAGADMANRARAIAASLAGLAAAAAQLAKPLAPAIDQRACP